MPPSKEQQLAESKARETAGVDPAQNQAAIDVIDDVEATARPTSDAHQSTEQRQPAPPPFVSKRDEIIQRFRTDRIAAAQEDKDDFAEFARGAEMPAEFRQPALGSAEEEAAVDPQPTATDEAPAKHKLKVHGQELELSLDEILAKAQIAIASENILDEVKSMKRDLAERLSRVEQPQHQQRTDTRTAPQQQEQQSADPASPDQEDEIAKLMESLQFGDPAEARVLFQHTIEQRAAQAAEKALQQQRLRDEGARTAKVLSEFKGKHPDIAKDPLADAALQTRMYQLQIEDLHALGVDPNQIQTPSGHVTPADIAMAHRWYRSAGFSVRKAEDLLEKAVSDFVEWKGVGKTQPTTQPAAQPATGKAPPRVEVAVERDARRAAIPQQPDRAAAPRTASTQQAVPQVRDRSSIVQSMIAARTKPRGKVGIA